MKIYVPSNLNSPLLTDNSAKLYGWRDELTGDIFICSFSEPTEIEVNKYILLL